MVKSGRGPALALAGTCLFVAGCSSSLGGLNTQPAPLTPAPSGTVSSSQLPPPSQPQVSNDPSAFPQAPGGGVTDVTDVTDTEVTDADNEGQPTAGSVTDVASAPPVTREALIGAWQVSTEGQSCQMFMALTQWTGGYRAASRGCPGDAANVSAWDVNGNQVVLSDSSGNRVATLFSSGGNRFDGQTIGGRAISLSR